MRGEGGEEELSKSDKEWSEKECQWSERKGYSNLFKSAIRGKTNG